MKALHTTAASLCIVCILTLTSAHRAISEEGHAGNAKVLLDAAKKKQSERKRIAMQTELDRLGEDVKVGQQELGDVEKSISDVGNAVNQAKGQIDLLAGRKKNVTQDMELLALRAEAERLKAEALSLLNSAHAKTKDALTKRNEELELKKALVSAQMQKMSESESTGDSASKKANTGTSPTLTELRRDLARAESKTEIANYKAHEAMNAASLKLQQADAAAAKAEKKQAEFAAEKTSGGAKADDTVKPKAKNAR